MDSGQIYQISCVNLVIQYVKRVLFPIYSVALNAKILPSITDTQIITVVTCLAQMVLGLILKQKLVKIAILIVKLVINQEKKIVLFVGVIQIITNTNPITVAYHNALEVLLMMIDLILECVPNATIIAVLALVLVKIIVL